MKFAFALLAAALCVALVSCDESAADMAPKRVRAAPIGITGAIPFDHHLLVDQFGYRPGDPKVAVIRDPQVGFDASDHFIAEETYEIRRASDGQSVFQGKPVPWKSGTVESSSGDRGWWFDFSALETPGIYYLYAPARRVRSATFRIDQTVYRDVLKAATRMYFYQRSGFAKQRPYAEACWLDEPAYIGPGQDLEARDITDRDNPGKARNLTGGWFDAGDTNKYVTLAATAVHQLLTAYQDSPSHFTDDFNIPESGNGVPDLLDEVKWEIDWLVRMQYPNGSAALKVGEIVDTTGSLPSKDRNPRYFIPSCTSATIAVAGMFAHASWVFQGIEGLKKDSDLLRARSLAAWNNFQNAPSRQTHCDTGVIRAGNADWNDQDQTSAAVVAAVYLFGLTGEKRFEEYLEHHYRETRPYRDIGWSRYNPEQGEALLFYTTLTNADPKLKTSILADKSTDVKNGNHIYGFDPGDDLYRAYLNDPQYHWGSNAPRANYGNTNLDVVLYNLGGDRSASYENRALEILHYMHGVNPLGMVYLTNMSDYGATVSANEIFHTWFWHGTRWSDAVTSPCGPAPGYVPGGPNGNAVANGVPATLIPPAGQPLQKSYKDWNAEWPESSWAVTEPGIYYQSAYVRLLSYFSE